MLKSDSTTTKRWPAQGVVSISRARAEGLLCGKMTRLARDRRAPSMRLAWLSSSEKKTSPGSNSVVSRAMLAR